MAETKNQLSYKSQDSESLKIKLMMEQFKEKPHLVSLQSIGNSVEGYITVAEAAKSISFEIKRVYWTYYTPQNVIRGFHAHKRLQQVVFALSGSIKISIEERTGDRQEYLLNEPRLGLYLPPYTWREIQFTHNAVLLCLASDHFEEDDYIRQYEVFKNNAPAS